jgi:CHAT domain-containing protein/Flp pilus assembly protein TadD/AAA+ ATPase superfamily predicted ATPase
MQMKKLLVLLIVIAASLTGYAQSAELLSEQLDTAWSRKDFKNAGRLARILAPRAEKEMGGNPEACSELLNTIGVVYLESGNVDSAVIFLEKAVAYAAKLTDNPNYILALYKYNLAMAQMEGGRYAESEPNFLASLPLLAEAYGANSLKYTRCFYAVALLYTEMGKYTEAESMNAAAVNYFKVNPGQHSDDYLNSLNNMARIYQGQGRYQEAETFFTSLLGYYRQLEPANPGALSGMLNNLGELYRTMEQYDKAEPLFRECLDLSLGKLEDDPLASVSPLNNLALLYKATGRYTQAEASYNQSLKLYEQAGRKDHPDYTSSLNNLGELYRTMGRYQEAADAFARVIAIRQKMLGEDHVNYANALNNLGLVYADIGQYKDAQPLFEQALNIYKLQLGSKHIYYANCLHNLASVYASAGELEKAEKMKLDALDLYKSALGENSIRYAQYLSTTAILYFRMGKPNDALKLLEKARSILKAKAGESSFDYIDVLFNLSEVYRATGKDQEAQQLYLESLKGYRELIRNYFPGLSEHEKTQFYYTISSRFETFNSYIIERAKKRNCPDTLLCAMYDLQLATKGLLLSESSGLYPAVKASGKKDVEDLYNKWIQHKKQLAQYYRLTTEELSAQGIDLGRHEKEVNAIEKELYIKTGSTGSGARSWKNVQKALGTHEAAIEMVRIEYDDGKKRTGDVYYAALVVTKDRSAPQLVLIDNGAKLESEDLPAYRKLIRQKKEENGYYVKFWKPVSSSIKNVSRIYLSPDGLYQQVNLYTLVNPETKKYLVEELEIALVTNTSELTVKKQNRTGQLTAELFGYPNYDADNSIAVASGLTRFGIDHLSELPGTKVEVDTIAHILESRKWKTKKHLGGDASEEALKEVKHPAVLHIATHGYFLKNVDAFSGDEKILGIQTAKSIENPLLRSGLMLAGAAAISRDTEGAAVTEDGILTAYEASTLDLSQTELVVLSACETGLGEVRNGQGVYGLQRAFLVAGANAMIMSLWTVDDNATQELMTIFYDIWSKDPQQDKHKAFRTAQLKLKEKYPAPHYWGAFVLVGE